MLLSFEKKTNRDMKNKKMYWSTMLHYTFMLITLVLLSLATKTEALPHAIRIGAIFTGKSCFYKNRNLIYLSFNSNISFSTIFKKSIFNFLEDQKDSPAELAFKYAIYKINRDQEVRYLYFVHDFIKVE